MCSRTGGQGLLVVLLVLLSAFTVAAQDGPAAGAVPPPAAAVPPSTSLWKVETDSGVVYLMGSIHLLKESDFPLHPKMTEAFEEAGTLVLEADIDSAQTPAFQQYVLAKGFYGPGKTLQAELGDSVYSLLGAAVASVGLPLDQMNQLEPWMVALTFLSLKLRQLGFDPEFGVDFYFHRKAKAEGKPIEALETPEYQISLLDSMPPSSQRALVLQTLEQADDIEKALDAIVLQWKTGDLAGLDETINKSLEDYPEIRELLITRRNLNWLPEIEGYIGRRGTYLIITGVAHMSGENGIVTLLRKAGYRVEQM
jgi:uncharacterized protein YbaP (TraB family)